MQKSVVCRFYCNAGVATDQHVYYSLFLHISHAALFSTSKSNSETIYKFRHIYSL